jgi:probable O-glycosylation ligase (exosortase A-associated)
MIEPRIPWWREPAANGAGPTPGGRTTLRTEPRQAAGISFWALMGFTFILLLAPQEQFPVLAPLRIAMMAALLAIASHVFSRFSRGLPVIAFTVPTKIVLWLVGWALITAPFSYWPGGSVSFLLENFFKTVIVFILLANVIDSRTKLKHLTWGLVLMSIPLALTTVGNFSSGNLMQTGARVAGYSAGLTANPNDMALMLNLILPLCIALLLASSRASIRILLAAVACLLVIAIVATFSRGGFVALMVTGLTYLWLYRNRAERAWIPVIVVMGLLAFPIIPSDYLERISTIVNITDDSTHSAETRIDDMKAAVRLAVAKPLVGSGIGMNVLALNEARGKTWTAVHNVYLQYLVELGLPGLGLFLLLYIICMRATGTVLRTLKADRSGGLFHIAEGLRVSLIAFAVAALFHPVAYNFYFYYIAGMAMASQGIADAALRATGQPAQVAQWATLAGPGKAVS